MAVRVQVLTEEGKTLFDDIVCDAWFDFGRKLCLTNKDGTDSCLWPGSSHFIQIDRGVEWKLPGTRRFASPKSSRRR